jgi:hypothetical protein
LTSSGAARVALRTCREYAELGLRLLARHELVWFLAYRRSREHFVANTTSFRPHGFSTIMPPEGHGYADPCAVEWKGEQHLFFEDYRVGAGHGVIAWMQLTPDGGFSTPVTVLEQPYHLSYPFVFAHEGDMFMVPETSAAQRVELYRATAFPHRWESVAVLLDGLDAVDATLHQHSDRWWMFVNIAEDRSSTSDELFIFYADSPYGPWLPHPRNPVKSDVRSARPAGRLFRRGDRLIRPAQNSARCYGGAMALCEVIELTTRSYRERVIEHVGSDWLRGNERCHTLSFTDGFEVVDGCMSLSRARGAARRTS